MISGLYLGELVRLIMVQLTRDNYLFKGVGSAKLYTTEAFLPSYIFEIEEDPPGTYTKCKKVFKAIGQYSALCFLWCCSITCFLPSGLEHATEDDCVNVRYICECISRRSGKLVGAALAALVNRINEPTITIGIDGSVYNRHPHYHNTIVTTLEKLVKRGIKVINFI